MTFFYVKLSQVKISVFTSFYDFQANKILWPTGSNMQLITELEISGVSIQPMITLIAYVIPQKILPTLYALKSFNLEDLVIIGYVTL